VKYISKKEDLFSIFSESLLNNLGEQRCGPTAEQAEKYGGIFVIINCFFPSRYNGQKHRGHIIWSA
jgi:hypothetical protein